MSFRARRLVEPGVEPFPWETLVARPVSTSVDMAGGAEGPDQQTRLAALERDAFAKGYSQGEHAGAEAASARANEMVRRLGQTVEELAALRTEMIRRTERQTVQLVLAIAETGRLTSVARQFGLTQPGLSRSPSPSSRRTSCT